MIAAGSFTLYGIADLDCQQLNKERANMYRSRLRLVFALTMLLALLMGPYLQPAQAQSTSGKAWIRGVNASPDATVNIYVNEAAAAKNIAPGGKYEFEVPAGKVQVSFRRGSAIINNASTDLELAGGDYVTVVALNKAAELQLLVLRDDASAVTRGLARVRVFNAIVGGSNIDVATADGTAVASNVAFGAASEYTMLVNGSATFKVTAAGDAGTVLTTKSDVTLNPERRYDIFVIGVKGGKTAAYPLEAGTQKATGSNQIRFAHFAPGTGLVDVALNGKNAFVGVKPSSLTSTLVVAPGSYKVEVYQYNKRDKVLVSQDINVEKDQSVLVGFVGKADALALKTFAEDYKPLRVGLTRVQFVNMAPNKPDSGLDTTSGAQLVAPVSAGSSGSAEVSATGLNLVVVGTDGKPLANAQIKGASGTATVVIVYENTATGGTTSTAYTYPVDTIVPVRFVHASPSAKAVDVYLDSDKVLSNWAFGASTDYVDLAPGVHELKAFVAGQDPTASTSNPVIDRKLDLGGFPLTAVMFDQGGIPAMTLFSDNLNQIGKGKARVRLIQASPEVGTVKWVNAAGGTPMTGDAIGIGEASNTIDLTAGSYTFQVSSITDKNLVLRFNSIKLDAGSFVTFVVSGPTLDDVLTLKYQVTLAQ
jgi:hypothetical protein